MSTAPKQQQIQSLLDQGLRRLREGKVSAALKLWEEALTLDESNQRVLSFVEYVKKNRIRIAVHLGRSPLQDHEPIDIPKQWQPPPPGLCDPIVDAHLVGTGAEASKHKSALDEAEPIPAETSIGTEDEAAHTDSASTGSGRPAARSSGDLPYAELTIGTSSQPRLSDVLAQTGQPPESGQRARPSSREMVAAPRVPRFPLDDAIPVPPPATDGSHGEDDYLAMEILVDDGDDEPEPDSQALPPPPEALDAPPEMLIEAPDQASPNQPPEDYLFDRDSSSNLEGLPLDQLADPPAEPGTADGPSIPRVATTFDEVATNPRADPHAFSATLPKGLADVSPYTTLAGLGPRVLFADVGGDLAGDAPPPRASELPARTSPGEQGSTLPPPDDYEREQGSFSEDAPTRARGKHAAPPVLQMESPPDFDREEGSFSDEIPTRGRISSPAPGASEAEPPGDYERESGSFADDLPTRARPSMQRAGSGYIAEPFSTDLAHPDGIPAQSTASTAQSEGRIRAMPMNADLSQENSIADDAATLDVMMAELGGPETILTPTTGTLGADNDALDPRAAFLFSRIDAPLSVQDILDVSGMSSFETTRLLLRLLEMGLLELRTPR